jgi:type II secretory ATPase GspE/PulE/Tfp pilus assembly ATPase PilB-like protein
MPPSSISWFRGAQPEDPHVDSRLFNELMASGVEQQATDIHLEAHEQGHLARLRVNGILREHKSYPLETGERLVAIAKVRASLDVADKQKPHDGRFEWKNSEGTLTLDVRVSVSPSLRGEKMALRFLNRPASAIDMASLGMNEAMQRALTRAVRHPEGFILIAGPTGSGKTSSAYSILSRLAKSSVNIMTIEDPIEYTLPYATQIAINPKTGITFQSGLTTLLRQDPDIILIGEMREAESFRTGLRASLSGHLVISTMHARDAIQVFANLRNIGMEPSSLAAAVKLVVAQRLVRILCPDCKIQDQELDEDVWTFLGPEAERIPVYQPGEGCERCFHSGFVGRTGVFEYLTMDSTIREWLEQEGHESDLRRKLDERGFSNMRNDAREKVFAGYVWADDAIRTTGVDVS